jgi:membrane-bound lytic murein transglycosylase B
MILEIMLSGTMFLSSGHNHDADIAYLQRRLAREGYNISKYIKDSRFQIYEPKGENKPVNYAKETWYMVPDSIEKCADFMEENWVLLERVRKDFSGSPEYMVSQLQLETRLGKYTGEYPAFNAMVSKYLHRKGKKKEEFYKYLRDYLKLCADTSDNIILSSDVFENLGSHAGAIGINQVMSSNMDDYLIDYNNDGRRDPNDREDAVGALSKFASKKKIQAYNPNDKFYESSITKHAKELIKIMEKRKRIPPKKISYNIKPIIANIQYPPRDNLQQTKILAMAPEPIQKSPFIKRIISNIKIGKR